jgi:hypothetical protein
VTLPLRGRCESALCGYGLLMGPLSRFSWSMRAVAFVIVVVVVGLLFGFGWPLWVGALVGASIGLAQWRRERSPARVSRRRL